MPATDQPCTDAPPPSPPNDGTELLRVLTRLKRGGLMYARRRPGLDGYHYFLDASCEERIDRRIAFCTFAKQLVTGTGERGTYAINDRGLSYLEHHDA